MTDPTAETRRKKWAYDRFPGCGECCGGCHALCKLCDDDATRRVVILEAMRDEGDAADARLLVFMRKMAEAWDARGMEGIGNAIRGECREVERGAHLGEAGVSVIAVVRAERDRYKTGFENASNALDAQIHDDAVVELERNQLRAERDSLNTIEDVVKWLEGPNFCKDEEDEDGNTGEGRHSAGPLMTAKRIRKQFGLPEQEPW